MLGQSRVGQVRLEQVRLGQVRLGQVRLGQVRLGQVRLGQVRLGQVRLGQVRLGQIRLSQSSRLGQVSETFYDIDPRSEEMCKINEAYQYLIKQRSVWEHKMKLKLGETNISSLLFWQALYSGNKNGNFEISFTLRNLLRPRL